MTQLALRSKPSGIRPLGLSVPLLRALVYYAAKRCRPRRRRPDVPAKDELTSRRRGHGHLLARLRRRRDRDLQREGHHPVTGRQRAGPGRRRPARRRARLRLRRGRHALGGGARLRGPLQPGCHHRARGLEAVRLGGRAAVHCGPGDRRLVGWRRAGRARLQPRAPRDGQPRRERLRRR